MNICTIIEELIVYGRIHLNLPVDDIEYTRNQLYHLFNVSDPKLVNVDTLEIEKLTEPSPILNKLSDYIKENNLDINFQHLACNVMDLLIPRPSSVNTQFYDLTGRSQTDYLYDLSIKSYYIRKNDIDRNIIWEYPNLIITINLSKPEIINNNPKQVIKTNYPNCPLCIENIGFHGSSDKESRQNLRAVPIKLNQEDWYFQYSPYVYYQEHCIIFSKNHTPMGISYETFKRLVDFVDLFPHYFLGSNAGLQRIGGSILGHDHYQGGNYTFPLQAAQVKETFNHRDYPDVKLSTINWYNSVLRLESTNRISLINLADLIYKAWKNYDNEELDIISYTTEQHNGITPIVHKENDTYVMNIILRNNRTNTNHPDGIFHAHKEYHHIKKEGIGLIEAMGMFILPGRLKQEINDDNLQEKKNYIYDVCINILKNTAVFKDDELGNSEFKKFISSILNIKGNH